MLAIGTPASAGQDAVVTFYSHGSALTSGLPGSNHGIYFGCIYDGTQRLACFQDGFFIKNNRYIVFQLPPGPHTFSASYGKHPAKNSQFPIQLDAGKNYFLRAQSESRGIIEIEFERGRLDEVTCDIAQKETEKAKPLKIKQVSSPATAKLNTVQTVPTCP